MKTLPQMLRELAKPEVVEFAVASDRLPCVKIGDQYHPVEVGALVPPRPTKLMDPRPNRARVMQSADVFVDKDGIVYSTDMNSGLYIMEYNG